MRSPGSDHAAALARIAACTQAWLGSCPDPGPDRRLTRTIPRPRTTKPAFRICDGLQELLGSLHNLSHSSFRMRTGMNKPQPRNRTFLEAFSRRPLVGRRRSGFHRRHQQCSYALTGGSDGVAGYSAQSLQHFPSQVQPVVAGSGHETTAERAAAIRAGPWAA